MEIAHPLRGWMDAQQPSLSQTEAAKKLGVSEGYLSQVLSWKKALSMKRAGAWSVITGLPLESFQVPQREAAQ